MISQENITEYKSAIERLAEDNSEFVFRNSGSEHAAIVLSTILNKSKKTVRIYAKDMDGTISNQSCYANSIRKFISGGGKLQVIVDDVSKVSDTIKTLIDSIDVKISSNDFKRELQTYVQNDELPHFAVGDDKMIRVELDNKNHKALCSFNVPDTAKMLNDFFDRYFQMLAPATIK